MSKKWRKLSDIPNVAGTPIIARDCNEKTIRCEVKKDTNLGIYRLWASGKFLNFVLLKDFCFPSDLI